MNRPPAPRIPTHADERTTLVAFLDFYRASLLDRAWGLDHAQLQIALPPSSLTLSRLIGHMAKVESIWFQQRFAGEDPPPMWASLDWEADVDAEMTLAQSWTTEELLANFGAAVDDSRSRLAAVESLDELSVATNAEGERWDMRWILVHMIEEYARHCGHADFIRESIDGNTAG